MELSTKCRIIDLWPVSANNVNRNAATVIIKKVLEILVNFTAFKYFLLGEEVILRPFRAWWI
jgi:hypothetical protein